MSRTLKLYELQVNENHKGSRIFFHSNLGELWESSCSLISQFKIGVSLPCAYSVISNKRIKKTTDGKNYEKDSSLDDTKSKHMI